MMGYPIMIIVLLLFQKATIRSGEALQNVDTLIIGGMDRGINYTELIEFINESELNHIICMPKTGHDIANKIEKENLSSKYYGGSGSNSQTSNTKR